MCQGGKQGEERLGGRPEGTGVLWGTVLTGPKVSKAAEIVRLQPLILRRQKGPPGF